MTPTVGRIVHYRLNAQDETEINRRRKHARKYTTGESGVQQHIGSEVAEGYLFPMTVVRMRWDSEGYNVNGQVHLDGNDVLWVVCRKEGTEPGTWSWPPREGA